MPGLLPHAALSAYLPAVRIVLMISQAGLTMITKDVHQQIKLASTRQL